MSHPVVRADQMFAMLDLLEAIYDEPQACAALKAMRSYITALSDDEAYQADVLRPVEEAA